jgi:hypothetical protein
MAGGQLPSIAVATARAPRRTKVEPSPETVQRYVIGRMMRSMRIVSYGRSAGIAVPES